jgi:hypothetical protein
MASVVVAGLILAACGGGGGKGTPADKTQAGGVTTTGKATPAAADKGPDKNITLTADTVVVDGDGGKALKSFGPDGRSLVLDAGAKGADQLAAGKILLLTGVTVVRSPTERFTSTPGPRAPPGQHRPLAFRGIRAYRFSRRRSSPWWRIRSTGYPRR